MPARGLPPSTYAAQRGTPNERLYRAVSDRSLTLTVARESREQARSAGESLRTKEIEILKSWNWRGCPLPHLVEAQHVIPLLHDPGSQQLTVRVGQRAVSGVLDHGKHGTAPWRPRLG
jgi:hypothetical protein